MIFIILSILIGVSMLAGALLMALPDPTLPPAPAPDMFDTLPTGGSLLALASRAAGSLSFNASTSG